MRARNTSRPLCDRAVRVGLGGKGKRVKQDQTDMIQLRRSGLQSVKIRWRGGYLTTRMGFRHPHVSALFGHLLTALPLGRCHRCIGQNAYHHWQRGEQYRHSDNNDFLNYFQHYQFNCSCELDATGSQRYRLRRLHDLRLATNAVMTHGAGGASFSQYCLAQLFALRFPAIDEATVCEPAPLPKTNS